MYGLMARAPGILLLILGVFALFDGGWITLLGVCMIGAGVLLLRQQLANAQQGKSWHGFDEVE